MYLLVSYNLLLAAVSWPDSDIVVLYYNLEVYLIVAHNLNPRRSQMA